jgi:hypothetical protein
VFGVEAEPEPTLQGILDEMHELPDRIADGLPGLLERLHQRGLDVRTTDIVS